MKLPDDPLLRALEARIVNQLEDMRLEIAKGNCADFAEYKRKCGVVQGLDDALGWLEVTAREYMLEEDGEF
jgi:hypothetical protein